MKEISSGAKRGRTVPPLVYKRAVSAGAAGRDWLINLDRLISALEDQWQIKAGSALSGGTHAYVAYAEGRDGKPYVLKIDMPKSLGHAAFSPAIRALKTANGQGYAKLFAYDREKKACLLERLGKPLKDLKYPVYEQIGIICETLQKSWQVPVQGAVLPDGDACIAWFRDFIETAWNALQRPCSQEIIQKAFRFLQEREKDKHPEGYVLVHGDAHNTNTLQALSAEDGFKMIDPDGIFYEKAYDLGVLMREWTEEYRQASLQKGLERLAYLHSLTGVDQRAIWEWGFLQTISTGFVLLQIGQKKAGNQMLQTAEAWNRGLF